MREYEWLMDEPTAEEWEELLRPKPSIRRRTIRSRKPPELSPKPANDDGSPSSPAGGR